MRVRIALWTLFFVGLTINIHRKGGGLKQEMTAKNILFLALSLFAVWAIAILLETIKDKKISAAVAFIFAAAFYYFKRVASPLSYNLIINNSDFFFNWVGISQIFSLIHSTFFASDFFWSLIFSLLIYFSYRRWPFAERKYRQRGRLAVGSIFIIMFVSLIPSYSQDPLTNFIRSTYRHYFPYDNILSKEARDLPMAKLLSSSTHFNYAQKPNIFLVIVESFNSRFIDQKSEEGLEFTPFINQLKKKQLYFSNYRSNSVQTAKGQFAALCGQVPLSRGIEFKNAQCMTERCVASILAERGYETYFIQADPNFATDNTQKFMREHGFQYTPEIVKPCGKDPDKCYGMGIGDDVFYKRAFEAVKDRLSDKTPPVFVTLATVSSHMPFNHLSPDEMQIYKKPRNIKENYLNLLRKVDDSLKELVMTFEKSPWAQDSVLIITGDHGFPTGEHHGSSHNENYAYAENFGVPLLIYDFRQNLKKKFEHVENLPFSHMNLGMTILDIAQIVGPTEFIAPSVFDIQTPPLPTYLVQPYSGGYQSSVVGHYKHVFSDFREEEVVYDLEKDPNEMSPILEAEDPALFARLRKVTAQIYRQQEVFVCE